MIDVMYIVNALVPYQLQHVEQYTISEVVHNQVKLSNQLVNYMCESEAEL